MPNTFTAKRHELDTAEKRRISDWQIGALLGIQPKHVYNLSRRPSERVRPCYLLALQLAIERGIDYCDEIDDPTPEEFDRIIRSLPIQRREVAMMLGITASGLRYLRRTPDVIIPRAHVLAVHYLSLQYAEPPALAAHRRHAMAYRTAVT